MSKTELREAFSLSLPVLGAYWFLGITYGLLASTLGYSLWFPVAMAMIIYSGSVEFLALTILLGTFHPLSAAVVALMVGARHLFYGLSMLPRWRNAGWRKPLLIFWMSDETFAVNYNSGGSLGRQLWVSLLDYLYWVSGAVMGFMLGSWAGEGLLRRLEGLDFVVTAMFVAIFMDDFLRHRGDHSAAWTGIGVAVACLWLFGGGVFMVPTMLGILAVLYIKYRKGQTR